MVRLRYNALFIKKIRRIKDPTMLDRIKGQIQKIKLNPEIGKPMRYSRKGTRELYIHPYRLSYLAKNDKILILDIYHKDGQ